MSRNKLVLFTILVMITLFAAAARLNRRIKQVDVRKPNARPHNPELAADAPVWYRGQPTNNPSRAHWIEEIHAGSDILPTVFLPIQSRNANDLAAGKLLVASRDLADPNFVETVVLLLRYDAQGVAGLVLNRRTHVPLSRVLGDLKAARDRSDPVYLGGPVDTAVVFALFYSPAKIEGAEHVFDGVYLISAKSLFEQTISTRPDPGVFHVYLGYAGWNKNQLQKEVELGAWFIFPADTGVVFNSDPDSLWSEMIRKTELRLAANEPSQRIFIAGTAGVAVAEPTSARWHLR